MLGPVEAVSMNDDARGAFAAPRDDLRVAAVAAAGTIVLTLGIRVGLGRSIPLLARMAPLFVYFVYLLTRHRLGGGPIRTVRGWSVLVVAVTALMFVLYAA